MRQWVTTSIVVLVAIVAGILSASHIITLGLEAMPSEHDWQAYLLPLPIDGALLMASLSLAEARRQGRKPGLIVWTTLTLGVTGSIAANLAAAPPTLTARLLAVSAPIALALSVELLLSGSEKAIPAHLEARTDVFMSPESKDTREAISTPEIVSPEVPRNTVADIVVPESVPTRDKSTRSRPAETEEANHLIAQDYVTRGMAPNRAQVRQDHKVGAVRADKIIALVREAHTPVMSHGAEARELVPVGA